LLEGTGICWDELKVSDNLLNQSEINTFPEKTAFSRRVGLSRNSLVIRKDEFPRKRDQIPENC
jgi:hypothetical protein